MSTLSLAVVLAVLVMSARLSRLPAEYRCSFCKTRTGDHAKDCPWRR